eukprot:225647-Amorphochlora_amoeboformis.AAC.1
MPLVSVYLRLLSAFGFCLPSASVCLRLSVASVCRNGFCLPLAAFCLWILSAFGFYTWLLLCLSRVGWGWGDWAWVAQIIPRKWGAAWYDFWSLPMEEQHAAVINSLSINRNDTITFYGQVLNMLHI